MQLLEQRILAEGEVKSSEILKVDRFLNHQMDIDLFNEMGKEFYRLFGEEHTTVVHSFTHGNDNTIRISREYLSPDDRVLVIDDFLANGAALDGLITLIEGAGATVVGAGIAVEKAFQPGARGYRVESLARVQSMDPETGIVFC